MMNVGLWFSHRGVMILDLLLPHPYSRLVVILALAGIVMASVNGEMIMELNKFIIVNLIEVQLWWQPAN